MPTTPDKKIDGKAIGIGAVVLLLVGLAVWQGFRSMSAASGDTSFTTKFEAPPDNTRPANVPNIPAPGSGEKTGAD